MQLQCTTVPLFISICLFKSVWYKNVEIASCFPYNFPSVWKLFHFLPCRGSELGFFWYVRSRNLVHFRVGIESHVSMPGMLIFVRTSIEVSNIGSCAMQWVTCSSENPRFIGHDLYGHVGWPPSYRSWVIKLSVKLPSLSNRIPSFSGISKVRKFYYISLWNAETQHLMHKVWK
jgi:hypothetical protein